MAYYVGITIGPIYDTILLAKSPAAMWYASTFFSTLSKTICEKICEKGIDCENIISPYYDHKMKETNDGIGKYNDRIFVKCDNYETIKAAINEAKNAVIKIVDNDESTKAFLENYFIIHHIHVEVDDNANPLSVINEKLDALEQMTLFNQCENDTNKNPFKILFEGKADDRNYHIKESNLLSNAENSQLKKNESELKSIGDISKTPLDKEYKVNKYFAIVDADGDRMGSHVSGLCANKVRDLSKKLLEFDGEAADMIGKYGGMTVYAGGDDLLFLAPVIGKDGKNIFELCKELNVLFVDKIKADVSLSFGVAIRYNKFPLYEALNSAKELLYISKSDPKKNRLSIDLRKDSGQDNRIIVPFEQFELFNSIFKLYSSKTKLDEAKFRSVIYSLIENEVFFKYIEKTEKNVDYLIENTFNNLFDNISQLIAKEFVDECKNYYKELLCTSKRKISISKDSEAHMVLSSILRMSKFIVEKRGDSI